MGEQTRHTNGPVLPMAFNTTTHLVITGQSGGQTHGPPLGRNGQPGMGTAFGQTRLARFLPTQNQFDSRVLNHGSPANRE